MDGEQHEEDDYRPFDDFDDIRQALEDGNSNVSKNLSFTLPPLPKRTTKNYRSNQNANAKSRESSPNPSNQTFMSTTTDLNENNDNPPLSIPDNQLTTTFSAPSVLTNTNSKKRERSNNSSTSSTTIKPVKKLGKIEIASSNTSGVSFALQANHTNDQEEIAVTTATSTGNARAWARDTLERGTGPNDKPERIIVNKMAKPMWDVTRGHLISQQKAHLRGVHLRTLLELDVMPIEFFGAEKLHRYYATNGGILSEDMQALIGRQAREKAELVLQELITTSEKESRNATYFAQITSQIYEHEKDNGFELANIALQKVVGFYQKTETDRLEALATKEKERQPQN